MLNIDDGGRIVGVMAFRQGCQVSIGGSGFMYKLRLNGGLQNAEMEMESKSVCALFWKIRAFSEEERVYARFVHSICMRLYRSAKWK